MKSTVAQLLQNVNDPTTRIAMASFLNAIADQYSCRSLTAAGLVINAALSPLAKTGGSIWYGLVKGRIRSLAAGTVLPALSGTVLNATFNVFAFDINASGTTSSIMGVGATTLAGVRLPDLKDEQTRIGYLIINPTGTGNFVGGTTNLDDATVVPNRVFIDLIGAADQTFLRA